MWQAAQETKKSFSFKIKFTFKGGRVFRIRLRSDLGSESFVLLQLQKLLSLAYHSHQSSHHKIIILPDLKIHQKHHRKSNDTFFCNASTKKKKIGKLRFLTSINVVAQLQVSCCETDFSI